MTFPFHAGRSIEFNDDLPEAVDLAVIGGGVLGICTALYAARAGLSVVVLEKGRVAAEQSGRNWGWIRVQGRDEAEIPIALEAQDLWQELDAEAQGRLGLRQLGVTYFARDMKALASYQNWVEMAKPYGVSSRIMTRERLMETLGHPVGPWVGGLHTPTDMKAEPWLAVPELARMARSDGALVRENCAVRTLDIEAGRVTGVVTEKGRIKAGQVVLTGGSWSSLFLRRHGVDIPQLSVRSTVMATRPLPQVLNTAAVDDRLAMRPRADGGYTLAPAAYGELFTGPDALRHIKRYLPLALTGDFEIYLRGPAPKGYPDGLRTARKWSADARSPFEKLRVLDPEPNMAKVSEIKRRFAQAYPQVGLVETEAAWAGMIDVLPDVVPVVDQVAQLPGLITATGMCGHGFGIGPAFGRILADMAQGNATGHDMTRFCMARFSDGSKLRPGPNL